MQPAVFRVDEGERQHAAVEDEVGTVAVQCEILPVFKTNTNQFGLVLIVVGYVVFAANGIGGVEIIPAFCEFQYDLVIGFAFFPDSGKRFVQLCGGCLYAGFHSVFFQMECCFAAHHRQ